jgi:orotidine-5'-phosphate decarboxylase
MAADPRLIVALDYADPDDARRLVEQLDDRVAFYKIGLTLLGRGDGVAFAHALRAAGKQVFQDWKLHDISAQVQGAAAAIAEGGADLLTVHAEPQVMRSAVEGRGSLPTKLLGVTVLTSLNDEDLSEIGYAAGAAELVERRTRQAIACGMDGVVASPHEAARIREIADEDFFLIVTPGIRPAGVALHDQARAATPRAALRAGATHLVVGRPISAADDPRAAADAILEEMAGA